MALYTFSEELVSNNEYAGARKLKKKKLCLSTYEYKHSSFGHKWPKNKMNENKKRITFLLNSTECPVVKRISSNPLCCGRRPFKNKLH